MRVAAACRNLFLNQEPIPYRYAHLVHACSCWGNALQKSLDFVSNRIGMKFDRIVLRVNAHGADYDFMQQHPPAAPASPRSACDVTGSLYAL